MKLVKRLSPRLKWTLAYATATGAAALARAIALFDWWNSPFRYYHHVVGLDMHGIVQNARRFAMGEMSFRIQRGLTAAATRLFPDLDAAAAALIALNAAMGIGVATLTVFVCGRLFGDWRRATLAGIMTGCFGPMVMYDLFLLKESVLVFLLVFAMAMVLKLKNGGPVTTFLLGGALTLPVLCRITGLGSMALAGGWLVLHWNLRNPAARRASTRRRIVKPTALCLGAVAALTIAFCGNSLHTGKWLYGPQYLHMLTKSLKGERVARFHQSKSVGDDNLKPGTESRRRLPGVFRLLDNLAQTVNAFETPNNLNWYFIRDLIFPLRWLIGPTLLLPLGWSGIALWLFQRRWFRKESLPLLYLVAGMASLIIYYPLARYRLALVPVLAIAGADFIFRLIRELRLNPGGSRLGALGMIVMFLVVFIVCLPRNVFIRADDVYAMAVAADKGGMDPRFRMTCYHSALRLNPNHAPSIRGLTNALSQSRRFDQAIEVITPLWQNKPRNWKNALCRGAALLGSGRPEQAERVLLGANRPATDPDHAALLYYLGESRRLQGRLDEAVVSYREALSLNISDQRRATLLKSLTACER